MSKEKVKEEYKQHEVNPVVKSAIRRGEEIPPKFYRAVAEVIAFVLFRKRRIAV
jgi:flagellar biosynthetic protein FlhB